MVRPRSPDTRQRQPRNDASGEAAAARLGRQLARFRREHPPKSRIPDTLRGAVLGG
jgi:hypothetical protein